MLFGYLQKQVSENSEWVLIRSCISQYMSKYKFSLAGIFPYKTRIYDSVLIRENTGQKKTVYWHILQSAIVQTFNANFKD